MGDIAKRHHFNTVVSVGRIVDHAARRLRDGGILAPHHTKDALHGF